MTSTTLSKIAAGEKPASPIQKASHFLQQFKPQMALALPKHLNADRMTRLALTALSTNPKLLDCDSRSLAGAIITLSQLGLEIGVNGQAYLVPYKGRVTPVPGWRGLVDLVNRSGRATVWTGAVFDGDDFDYALGDSPYVKHRPRDEDDPKKLTHVYACGRVNGSAHAVIEVWRMAKVWKHRDKANKVGDRHYSYEHPEMYARKVPLLQVLKYMPSSIELSQAVSLSEASDSGEGVVIEGDQFVSTVDPETGEIGGAPKGGKAKTYAALAEQIKAATSAETASLVLVEARDVLPDEQLAELAALYKATWGGK